VNALDVLELLEKTSSTSEKQKILTANQNNTELAELIDAALNFKRKYYVKKFEVSLSEGPCCIADHESFISLLNILEKRESTGKEAINAVEHFFKGCSEQEAKWYARVLRKNLRAGFGLTEANKAGFNIPDFDVMLAKDGKEAKNLPALVKQGVYVSPKLDGYRCLAICSYGQVELFSRNGTEFENFPSIKATLESLCEDTSFILDGEIMSDDFNAMQQTAMSSKSKKSVGDVKYHVFGWIPVNEFNSSNFKMVTKERLENLDLFFQQNPNLSNIVKVDQTLVNSVDKILELERKYLAQGLEGAMALPNIPYYLGKKSNRLMKFKTMKSMDCKIVGMYEGEGKYAGMLGGLKLIQENGLECDVGSGFTDDDRNNIWNEKTLAIGRIAEIKYQDLSADGVMRFPVILRWRNDK
jgi:DNA ligase-1